MVWPLAALFAIFCAALLALGRQARGYGLWLLAGAVLGAAFSWQTAARFAVWTERYDGELVDLTACVEDLRDGYEVIREASLASGVPVLYTTGRPDLLETFLSEGHEREFIGTPMPIETFMHRDWETFVKEGL